MVPFLFQDYARSMLKHGYGYGLYEPQSSAVVKPGICGYLDESGHFIETIDISDAKFLAEKGLDSLGKIEKAANETRNWGPKVSESVRYTHVDLNAGASGRPAGIPVEASVLYTYSSTSNYGAILVCSEPVIQEGYKHKAPFREWAKVNAKKILQQYPDTKRHGFFVVTTAFSTKKASLNAWTNPENNVSIGFKADVVDLGEIAPSGEWYAAESASGWVHSSGCNGERKVVFFGGTYFKVRRIKFGEHVVKEVPQDEWSKFRSGAERAQTRFVVEESADDRDAYEVEIVDIGDESKLHTEELNEDEEDEKF